MNFLLLFALLISLCPSNAAANSVSETPLGGFVDLFSHLSAVLWFCDQLEAANSGRNEGKGVKIAVSGLGMRDGEDTRAWYARQMIRGGEMLGEGRKQLCASLGGVTNEHQFSMLEVHGTVFQFALNLEGEWARDDVVKVCVYAQRIHGGMMAGGFWGTEPFVCIEERLGEMQDVYEVDLGPEAGGAYMVHAMGVGGEVEGGTMFRVVPGPFIENPYYKNTQDYEANDRISPYPRVPGSLCERYTMGGKAGISSWYFDDKSEKEESYKSRGRDEIEELVSVGLRREEYYYGATDNYLHEAFDSFGIEGLEVLIIGSNVPRYESICIGRGAGRIVTLEYNKLNYDHPKLETVTVEEWESPGSKWEGAKFDVAISISSYEHDGLGRYGDPLNPDGDLESIKKARGWLKEGGVMFLSVPVGKDEVRWNEGRVYGRERLRRLMDGWKWEGSWGFSEDSRSLP
ncbi:hypothetical protein TrRE_jg11364 [Triparma retinervis]|uniref:DUF268 domain-containing protein n=1 Tax=Triparma retinervis TaxID=2557542 RepID=A0A9W7G352_9STRA|nr:hypothetical protein TrRE_jg11364 [Triparma retinervis]